MADKAILDNTKKAQEFYTAALKDMKKSKIPFMVAGTFAVRVYTGIDRPTKDLDFFCKAGDFPKLLNYLKSIGYSTEIEDERWIAKGKKGRYFFDIIFGSTNAVTPVTEYWFENAIESTVLNNRVKIIPPEELIYSKLFVQDRYKYDGSDIAHLMLQRGNTLDWKHLLTLSDQYWEVLLEQIINFRFIYPSEREKIPRWILDELLSRLNHQINGPTSSKKVCRGRLFSRSDYAIDIHKWGFADLIGDVQSV